MISESIKWFFKVFFLPNYVFVKTGIKNGWYSESIDSKVNS